MKKAEKKKSSHVVVIKKRGNLSCKPVTLKVKLFFFLQRRSGLKILSQVLLQRVLSLLKYIRQLLNATEVKSSEKMKKIALDVSERKFYMSAALSPPRPLKAVVLSQFSIQVLD